MHCQGPQRSIDHGQPSEKHRKVQKSKVQNSQKIQTVQECRTPCVQQYSKSPCTVVESVWVSGSAQVQQLPRRRRPDGASRPPFTTTQPGLLSARREHAPCQEDDDTHHLARSTTFAMGEEQRCSTVTTALLVLVACNLTLALSSLSPPPSAHDHDDATRVEPVGYLASVASSVLAAYVASSVAARHGRRRRPSVEAIVSEARRTWTRPAMTALYVELLTTAMASLLLTLRAFLGAAVSTGGEVLAVSASVGLVGWLGPVLFAHSDIACRMGLLVAAVEEGYEGRLAVERAEALVAGRRVRGVAIAFAASLVEQAPSRLWCGAPAIFAVAAVLAAKLAACYACAVFYYQCRARHDGKNTSGVVKVQGVTKCCEAGWDRELSMVDETEADAMDSVLGCFRLT